MIVFELDSIGFVVVVPLYVIAWMSDGINVPFSFIAGVR